MLREELDLKSCNSRVRPRHLNFHPTSSDSCWKTLSYTFPNEFSMNESVTLDK